ncbi:MAG: hypothetical protein OXI96_07975 [Acidimicrobiaceae bacterium]|nr:hypothetical protein [Acidimicrobiaceae bacterium]
MLHCLAYGNADQKSFRDPDVRDCFEILTVPSTIASYYEDATAAFVLSSQLDYIIEPRTPLFQEHLQHPRKSHYTLASFMGTTVDSRLISSPDSEDNQGAYFPAEFYSVDVCNEVVASFIDFQRQYGSRADSITEKLERYDQLLRKAHNEAPGTIEQSSPDRSNKREPKYILCPYFAVRDFSDRWWDVMRRIWDAAQKVDDPEQISPIVSMMDISSLQEAIEQVPSSLSSRVFFWIPSFREHKVEVGKLQQLIRVVCGLKTEYDLMNLYGGCFSILLGKLGLDGFNNGLGYSESRDWPTLDSTGAAPARYYVRKLHTYLPTATATALIERDNTFACGCNVCNYDKKLPSDLNYHELKRHFALARAWELRQAEKRSLSDLCSIMLATAERVQRVLPRLPEGLGIPSDHLIRWAHAFEPWLEH